MEKQSKNITILVNGAILANIDTGNAVAADYIVFMQAVIESLMHVESLEREANASGKTIRHPNFGSFGSLPVKDPLGL